MGHRSQHDPSKGMPTVAAGLGEDTRLTQEEFADLLGRIDDGLRALPATGQVSLGFLLAVALTVQ